ncbi:PP2C family protein-serine/threonine phosphatase [Vulcanisaeta sp. JCM 14467]|uniref:PP2C family protein-serine/threonine phosphatase n=1 Tax=Vulcanisaeta sp. JCM 14467 TaxID=1295370 RepID=UPI0006D1FB70|nr:protein phosphatase 2C domain-containing protein [Vulcanisaeta sp. JCM 14467]
MLNKLTTKEGYKVLISTCTNHAESLAFTYKAYLGGSPTLSYGVLIPYEDINTALAILRRVLLNMPIGDDLLINSHYYIWHNNIEMLSSKRLRKYLHMVNAEDTSGKVIIASPYSMKGANKERNEDSTGILSIKYCGDTVNLLHIFAIADGVSSLHGGDYASSFAVRSFISGALSLLNSVNTDLKDNLRELLMRIHTELQEYAEKNNVNTGTTFTGGVIMQRGNAAIATIVHIGDSRAYKIVNNTVNRITTDHSLGGHVITQALGYVIKNIDTYETMIGRNTYLILTTDGITDVVPDETIGRIAYEYRYPKYVSWALVNAAENLGTGDDATVLTIWRT